MLTNALFRFSFSLPHPHPNGPNDYAKLLYWENGSGVSVGLVGLLIHSANQIYYIQFGPKSMKGVADRDFTSLMSGTEGSFIGSLAEAQLVEGLRCSQDQLPSTVTRQSFFEMGDGEKLALAKRTFSEEDQRTFREVGKPTHEITLRDLNLDVMISLIFQIKNQECPKFAPWAGTILHQTNTENGASIIARILEAGGASKIAPAHNDELGWIVPIPVLLMCLSHRLPAMDVVLLTLSAMMLARFLGGVDEGWRAVNAISHLVQKEHKSISSFATWGLLPAIDMVLSGIIGTFTWGSPTRKILVLPEMLLDWAKEIEKIQQGQQRVATRSMRAARL